MMGIGIVAVGADQGTTHWVTRPRPARPAGPVAGARSERPRYSRFAAAMAAARADDAPHLVPLGDGPGQDLPPAAGRGLRRPVAAPWQAKGAPRRPIARWLGIGSCALVLGLVLATVTLTPIGPEIQRAAGLGQEWGQGPAPAAAPPADRALPTAPEPAAGRAEPQSGSTPPAGEGLGAAAEPDPAAAAVAIAAPAMAKPAARSVPVPVLKPRARRR